MNYKTMKKQFVEYFKSDKQKKGRQNLFGALWAIAASLIIVIIVLLSMGHSPIAFFTNLFTISFEKATSRFFLKTAIFMIASVAAAICFKIGFFNISISSQILASGLIMALFYKNFGTSTGVLLLSLLVSIVMSVAICLIIASLKIWFNMNEVIVSILFNWIFLYFVKFLIESIPNFKDINTTTISTHWMNWPPIFTSTLWSYITIGIALVISVLAWIVLRKTIVGFKMNIIESNPKAAEYAGIKQKRYTLFIVGSSGVLAALAGWLFYILERKLAIPIPEEPLSTGFDAITLSLLANNNPLGVVLSSTMYGVLNTDSVDLATLMGNNFKADFYKVLIGIIIYFSAIIVVFKRFRVINWVRNQFIYFRSSEFKNILLTRLKSYSVFTKDFVAGFKYKQQLIKEHKNQWNEILATKKQKLLENEKLIYSSPEHLEKLLNECKEQLGSRANIFTLYFSMFLKKGEQVKQIKEKIELLKRKNRIAKAIAKTKLNNLEFAPDEQQLSYFEQLAIIHTETNLALAEVGYFSKNEKILEAKAKFIIAKQELRKWKSEWLKKYQLYLNASKKLKDDKKIKLSELEQKKHEFLNSNNNLSEFERKEFNIKHSALIEEINISYKNKMYELKLEKGLLKTNSKSLDEKGGIL